MKIKKIHPLQWIAEPLERHPTFFQKKMFGCEALRLHDRLVLVLAAGREPWNGLLVCTSREQHGSLTKQFPPLKPHAVLGKWLYVSQTHEDFEALASRLAGLALRADPRIGVESKPRAQRPSQARMARLRSAPQR